MEKEIPDETDFTPSLKSIIPKPYRLPDMTAIPKMGRQQDANRSSFVDMSAMCQAEKRKTLPPYKTVQFCTLVFEAPVEICR